MSATAGIAAFLLASLMPARAPVPPAPQPDPMGRGYMGVLFQTSAGQGGPLSVSSVEPNQPAAKAGLRAGDVLIRVGPLEPTTFEQVVAHICTYRPGTVVAIEVLRDGQRKTFKVKLGARPAELDNPNRRPSLPLPDRDQ